MINFLFQKICCYWFFLDTVFKCKTLSSFLSPYQTKTKTNNLIATILARGCSYRNLVYSVPRAFNNVCTLILPQCRLIDTAAKWLCMLQCQANTQLIMNYLGRRKRRCSFPVCVQNLWLSIDRKSETFIQVYLTKRMFEKQQANDQKKVLDTTII